MNPNKTEQTWNEPINRAIQNAKTNMVSEKEWKARTEEKSLQGAEQKVEKNLR